MVILMEFLGEVSVEIRKKLREEPRVETQWKSKEIPSGVLEEITSGIPMEVLSVTLKGISYVTSEFMKIEQQTAR